MFCAVVVGVGGCKRVKFFAGVGWMIVYYTTWDEVCSMPQLCVYVAA